MGKYLLSLLLLASLCVSGCDFMRTLAGRPTSADLENKRQQIEAAAAAATAAAAARDTVVTPAPVLLDSLSAIDSLRAMGCSMIGKSRLGGSKEALPHAYYIVIGSFQSVVNAGRQEKKASEAGFETVIIAFRNGLYATAVSPSDTPAGIYENYKALRRNAFCPKDAWILVNR